jgi:hypothetical protein
MAYAVGLIATGGCLIEGGRAIAFASCGAQLVERLLEWIYRDPDAPSLLRKMKIWTEYMRRSAKTDSDRR